MKNIWLYLLMVLLSSYAYAGVLLQDDFSGPGAMVDSSKWITFRGFSGKFPFQEEGHLVLEERSIIMTREEFNPLINSFVVEATFQLNDIDDLFAIVTRASADNFGPVATPRDGLFTFFFPGSNALVIFPQINGIQQAGIEISLEEQLQGIGPGSVLRFVVFDDGANVSATISHISGSGSGGGTLAANFTTAGDFHHIALFNRESSVAFLEDVNIFTATIPEPSTIVTFICAFVFLAMGAKHGFCIIILMLAIAMGCSSHFGYVPPRSSAITASSSFKCAILPVENRVHERYESGTADWVAQFYDEDVAEDARGILKQLIESSRIFSDVTEEVRDPEWNDHVRRHLHASGYRFAARLILSKMEVETYAYGFVYSNPLSLLGIVGLPVIMCYDTTTLVATLDIVDLKTGVVVYSFDPGEIRKERNFLMKGWLKTGDLTRAVEPVWADWSHRCLAVLKSEAAIRVASVDGKTGIATHLSQ